MSSQPGPSKTTPARKRKAGGEGKKGKVFLEDKLLSLIGDVTTSKETVVRSKLDKLRSYNPESDKKKGESKEAKISTASEKRKRDKDRALAEAKATLAAKAKEKKMKKKPLAPTASPSGKTKKKSVGFA